MCFSFLFNLELAGLSSELDGILKSSKAMLDQEKTIDAQV